MSIPEGNNSTTSSRILALDALRGLSVFLMLLVNNFGVGEDTPKMLKHANWQGGVTLADFVFPWFLFCVGVAIAFSAASFARRGIPRWHYDLRIARRTVLLLALGFLVMSVDAGHPDFTIGVLQLIGLSYAISALLYDLPIHRRVYFALALLLIHWAVIKFLPNPGVHAGAFGEGHNIIHHFNRKYLAPIGLEGLPLVVPTTALVLIGSFIGDLARKINLAPFRRAEYIIACGLILTLGGFFWSLDLPFNKPLWTPAYVLLAAGTACILLGAFHIAIDIKKWSAWAFPFIVYGSNAILVYVLPIVFKDLVLRPLHISTGGWLRSLGYAAFWWVVMWVLYRKKLFLKV
ncbi:MAG: heparan-alpha-glucosaminide N-acetyltransferase domain-containing protein [Armatimonadota bacterium]|nr:heparan-alpha-glucosaminide N-acetyltransferase domain-containing protein [bacterium]